MNSRVYRVVMEQIQSTIAAANKLSPRGNGQPQLRVSSVAPTTGSSQESRRRVLAASSATHRVRMRFVRHNGWEVCFSDLESSQTLGRPLRFQDCKRVREIAQRGRAFAFPQNWLAMDTMFAQGEGAMILTLTDDQLQSLLRSLQKKT